MPSYLKGVDFPGLRVERIRREDSVSMPIQHFHSHYELYLLCEGRRQYFINNRTYPVEAGALVLIPPNCIHKTAGPNEPHARILLEIGASALTNALGMLPGLSLEGILSAPALVLQLQQESADRFQRIADDLLLEGTERRAGAEQLAALRLAEILVLISRQQRLPTLHVQAEMSGRHRKIYEVAGYIQSAYNEIASLEDISRRFYISKFHLCRTFRQVTGLTVQEYITAARINQAQQQLAEGDAPITQVAHNVGYGSLTYFERVFKREVGVPPGQYRSDAKAAAHTP